MSMSTIFEWSLVYIQKPEYQFRFLLEVFKASQYITCFILYLRKYSPGVLRYVHAVLM